MHTHTPCPDPHVHNAFSQTQSLSHIHTSLLPFFCVAGISLLFHSCATQKGHTKMFGVPSMRHMMSWSENKDHLYSLRHAAPANARCVMRPNEERSRHHSRQCRNWSPRLALGWGGGVEGLFGSQAMALLVLMCWRRQQSVWEAGLRLLRLQAIVSLVGTMENPQEIANGCADHSSNMGTYWQCTSSMEWTRTKYLHKRLTENDSLHFVPNTRKIQS